MKTHRCTCTLLLIPVFFLFVGCSPSRKTATTPQDAINEIRKALELPQLPLEFVETTKMINSPSGQLKVDVYQDSDGRLYSVEPITDQVVEIDARAVLSSLPLNPTALPPEEIREKVMAYVKAVVPNLDSLQPSLKYEEGSKIDNYFFEWNRSTKPGDMNRAFLQIGIHNSGLLFAYYNTLNIEN